MFSNLSWRSIIGVIALIIVLSVLAWDRGLWPFEREKVWIIKPIPSTLSEAEQMEWIKENLVDRY